DIEVVLVLLPVVANRRDDPKPQPQRTGQQGEQGRSRIVLRRVQVAHRDLPPESVPPQISQPRIPAHLDRLWFAGGSPNGRTCASRITIDPRSGTPPVRILSNSCPSPGLFCSALLRDRSR